MRKRAYRRARRSLACHLKRPVGSRSSRKATSYGSAIACRSKKHSAAFIGMSDEGPGPARRLRQPFACERPAVEFVAIKAIMQTMVWALGGDTKWRVSRILSFAHAKTGK